MAEKSMLLQYGGAGITVTVGTAIHRDALYGKQAKTAEKDGKPLAKVVLDPEGNMFDPADIAYLPTDSQGSLAEPALLQDESGTILEPQPSSFKEPRELREATHAELASLRVEAVIPARCQLPIGLYQTEYTYRDAPLLKSAILIVTGDGAFLLTGTRVDAPMQGRTDVYSFFDAEDEDATDDAEDEETPFMMF